MCNSNGRTITLSYNIYGLLNATDGYETTTNFRNKYSKDQLMIIAIIAHALIGDREKCLAHSMNNHISKPIKQKDLKKILNKWCNNKKYQENSLEYIG
ncbi:MAG: hypothetical protein AB8U25_01900 [Rickettsiales endosymbiont of Dermacentor nuttalli]